MYKNVNNVQTLTQVSSVDLLEFNKYWCFLYNKLFSTYLGTEHKNEIIYNIYVTYFYIRIDTT